MNKLLPLALVLFTASYAESQETYSGPANAEQMAGVTDMVNIVNRKLCKSLGLASGCSQGLACTTVVPPAAGGASCSPAQARNAGVRIFPQTFAGREEFFQWRIALTKFNELRAEIVAANQAVQKESWDTGTQTEKDAMCVAAKLSAGCLLYP